MKLFFPDNIFTRLLSDNLPANLKDNISFVPSPSIPGELKKDGDSAGLITPTDILSSPALFISSKGGISFEGILSNSYLYFSPDQKELQSLSLHGDVSSLEVILSKIFFRENYNSEIQVEIITDLTRSEGKNLLLIGDTNFSTLKFRKGLSFAEEMVDLLSLPFVNFIFASSSEEILKEINSSYEGVSSRIYDSVENGSFSSSLPSEVKEFVRENVASLIYELEDQDIDDIHQLIRLPYFYGFIQDIVEPKFI